MIFRWQGRVHDTSLMRAFPISSPAMPVIYLDEATGNVFKLLVDRQEGVEVQLAEPEEIKSMATRYEIPDLLATLPPVVPQGPSNRTHAHALIVEDDAQSRCALQSLLRRSGYGIESAATISEGLAKLDQEPKCLILDLNLPDGDGTVLLERIRSAQLPIKVAVTTGTTDRAQFDAACNYRPDAIFLKPINFTEVMDWLDAAA